MSEWKVCAWTGEAVYLDVYVLGELGKTRRQTAKGALMLAIGERLAAI